LPASDVVACADQCWALAFKVKRTPEGEDYARRSGANIKRWANVLPLATKDGVDEVLGTLDGHVLVVCPKGLFEPFSTGLEVDVIGCLPLVKTLEQDVRATEVAELMPPLEVGLWCRFHVMA
jgi:hypothetical protein